MPINDTPTLGSEADSSNANLELKILEMQRYLDDQQVRLDETFSDLVVVTRELHESHQEKSRLEQRLKEDADTLREQQARIGNLVAKLEQLEEQITQARYDENQAAEATSKEHSLTMIIQRQSQDLGKLIALLEQHKRAERTANAALKIKAPDWSRAKEALLEKLFKKHRNRAKIARQLAVLETSSMFDAQWYLNEYPDVAADTTMASNPARHYLLIGGFEGRNPCSAFDSAFYIEHYEDVRSSGVNPLLHYLKFGVNEGRRTQAAQ